MLLLISPPGYGKTTLMEYVASRLGLVFVKVNGPALGHEVTSLDPAETLAATARQEVEKINLAFEMGNNVMLYLDDIQHTNPELLQKFISLCDAQRRVEGVWRGRSRTYDLRGRRFAVVMAGNPYTESGTRFQVPDMLANRADTYNLGDILDGRVDLFELSYIENALTSSPVLAPLVARSRKDTMTFVRHGRGEPLDDAALEHDYSSVEREEVVGILRRLWSIQRVLSQINRAYIESAAQEDHYRTEPPFKLQGSYRNMVKLASRVSSAMNESDLERLIDDHYLGEAQTLTTGAEQNLLKLAEIRGKLTPEQAARWEAMKREFRRRNVLGGGDDDPVVRVTAQLSALGSHVEAIAGAIHDAAERQMERAYQAALDAAKVSRAEPPRTAPAEPQGAGRPTPEQLAGAIARALTEALQRVAVNLEVVNMPPPTYHELLAHQIRLTEQLLVPLVRSSSHSLKGTKAVWDKMNEILESLRSPEVKAAGGTARSQTVIQPFRPPSLDDDDG